MHELGVVFNIINTVEEVGKENNLTSIKTVTIELGEVSTVVPEYLTDCWEWAKKKHPLIEDAQMLIEKLPAITYCEDCKKTYETIKYGRTCPYCDSPNTYLQQGNEFNIKAIGIED